MNRALLFLIVLAALFGVSMGESSWLQSLRRRIGFGASSNIPAADGKSGNGNGNAYGTKKDCEVDQWVSWGSCSRTCGTGSQQRTRRIVHPASNGGTACPATSDSMDCNTQSCSTDCVVGEWQNWGSCSATCGGGHQTRTRMILTQPSYGGAACPATTDTMDCNTQSCAVNCVVGEWQNWGSCSKTCGGGKQARTRMILTEAQGGGSACPATTDSQDCNTQPCVVNCVMGEWTDYSECSATCGGGQKARTRSILTQPSYGGTACSATSESLPCNTFNCPVDCVMGEWTQFGQCSASCGGGYQTRTRAILTHNQYGGSGCSETTESQPCNSAPCAVNCVMGEWTAWGSCSASCGGGQTTRTRPISIPAANGGYACSETTESQPCNTPPCAVNCVMGEWTDYSECSATCGGGQKARTRSILTQPSYGGTACSATSESLPCNTFNCPVDCVMGEWTQFGQCSAPCGGGYQARTRPILTHNQYGGAGCAETIDTQTCNSAPCVVNCVMGEWTEWSQCSETCGCGHKHRTRRILTWPAYGGTECTATKEVKDCNKTPCPVNCVVGEWTPFESCSVSCGGGQMSRTRCITKPAAHGGTPCPETTESQPCNTQPCAVNCVMGEWTPFGYCSATCGGGEMTRTRTIETPAAYGGTECEATTESQPCNTQPCAVNCVMGEWTQFGYCSVTCGGGEMTRTRTIETPAAYGGTECEATTESQPCNTQPCAVNCVMGEWSPFGYCSVTCGGGEETRTRSITTPAANGGTECEATTESQPCNTQPCAVNCVVGEWTPFGYCSATCGGGQKTRTRSVTTQAAYGGTDCPATSESQPCNTESCAVNCVMGEWTDYGSCSASCGGGSMTRTRAITTPAANGGTACEATTETKPCNTQPCTVDCVVGEWSHWGSACSASCGGGQSTRTRQILTQPAYGGTACPPTSESQPCNTQPCAVNCEVGPWTEFGSCSATCGGGQQTRTRPIVTPASYGGTACPPTSESQPCNTQYCSVNCVMGEWQSWGSCSKTCGGGTSYRSRTPLTPATNGGTACGSTEDHVPCNTQACRAY